MRCIDINKDKCDLVHDVLTVDYCQVSGALPVPCLTSPLGASL